VYDEQAHSARPTNTLGQGLHLFEHEKNAISSGTLAAHASDQPKTIVCDSERLTKICAWLDIL
jgi:hypothetical protein